MATFVPADTTPTIPAAKAAMVIVERPDVYQMTLALPVITTEVLTLFISGFFEGRTLSKPWLSAESTRILPKRNLKF